MKTILLAASALLLCASACTHDSKPAASHARGRQPDHEFNPVTGNNERQPPFGPRSNKSSEQ